jgi:hypothetical protein
MAEDKYGALYFYLTWNMLDKYQLLKTIYSPMYFFKKILMTNWLEEINLITMAI